MQAWCYKLILNLYPPYLGTGIRVLSITPDYREIVVCMRLRWYNRNAVRTHFGGSLYAMTDPFYMLMLLQILGRGYIVWDKEATIQFIKPGRGTVTARFAISDEQIADIHRETEVHTKFIPRYTVDVVDSGGETVAKVIKTLYVRKKLHRA